MLIHVVQPGENFNQIAANYNLDANWLAACNAVSSDNALAIGQTLVIRFPAQVHTVQPGENFNQIAARYGITVRELWRRNWPLGGRETARPGEILVIEYQDENKLGSAVFNGYAYPFIDINLLQAESPYLTYMTPFTYGISADGRLLYLSDNLLRAVAEARGTQSVLHISTLTEDGSFNTARGDLILNNQDIQERLIQDILNLTEEKNFAGVDVDFEYLPGNLAREYADFLNKLRGRLRTRRKFLWAALAPKISRDQKGLLYEAHNYQLIGESVDAVLLMTYEWGYTYGPPMAVAPLPNVKAVLNYAVTEITPGQIFMGIPNYGYDWTLPFIQGVSRARSISTQEAFRLAIEYQAAIQYDETAQSPFFYYQDKAGLTHEVWFEDARSLDAKLKLINAYHFQGGGIWNLTRPFPQLWQVMDALYNII